MLRSARKYAINKKNLADNDMKPERDPHSQGKLFEKELKEIIDLKHPLAQLSDSINWKRFEEKFGETYCPNNGRPGISTRTMVGLTCLKYIHNVSDEVVLMAWVENPYWQYFCGERYFQHKAPCDRSNLSRWRKRIGEEGAEEFLQESLSVAQAQGLLKLRELKELYVDTTVQEKNIAYPSEANLLNRARIKLIDLAKEFGFKIRRSYTRDGRLRQIKAHRYAAAMQWNRARREIKRLRTILGRVKREIERQLTAENEPFFKELLELSGKILKMAKGGAKLYSIHEPEVEAIGKGKMHKRFEFGVKVSVVTTRKSSFVLGCNAVHGNPYDGHTLKGALLGAERIVGKPLYAKVGVDLGYRGHGIKERFSVFHPKLKRLTKVNRLFVRARSKIEATISFMKRCCRLGRNYLKGKLGDLMNALFSGAACNFSRILRSTS